MDVNRAQEELAICRRDNERLQAQIGTVTVILENNSTLQQTVRQLEHDFAEAKLSCSQLQQQLAELGSVREQYQRTIQSNTDLERQLDILRESFFKQDKRQINAHLSFLLCDRKWLLSKSRSTSLPVPTSSTLAIFGNCVLLIIGSPLVSVE